MDGEKGLSLESAGLKVLAGHQVEMKQVTVYAGPAFRSENDR